jgi:hypothetical protein
VLGCTTAFFLDVPLKTGLYKKKLGRDWEHRRGAQSSVMTGWVVLVLTYAYAALTGYNTKIRVKIHRKVNFCYILQGLRGVLLDMIFGKS